VFSLDVKMDMLAFLQDSTDDDSDSGKTSNPGATKTRLKEESHTLTTNAYSNTPRRRKVRRRGCIDVIPSSKARDSDIFSRSIPHRRGHWAGHVKIPVLTKLSSSPSSATGNKVLRQQKNSCVKAFRDLLEHRGISGTMVEHDNLHLSLSKHFSLQAAHLEPFVRQLTNLVRQEHPMNLCVESITASKMRSMWDTGIINEMVLLNEEKTRSFLCWKVRPNGILQRLVDHVDTVMKSYNQPLYYQPAKFHISIASFPGNVLEMMDAERLDVANSSVHEFATREDDEKFHVPVSNKCVHESSVTTGRLKIGACALEEHEEEDSSSTSSSSSLDESCLVPVNELICTLGTTKEFVISLRRREHF